MKVECTQEAIYSPIRDKMQGTDQRDTQPLHPTPTAVTMNTTQVDRWWSVSTAAAAYPSMHCCHWLSHHGRTAARDADVSQGQQQQVVTRTRCASGLAPPLLLAHT